MKCLCEKVSWFVISILISILCIYVIKPEAIISQQIVKSIDDLSLAHGEGYSQYGNSFINEEENAYFVYDLGEGTKEYQAIDLFIDIQGEMQQNNILIDLYHSGEGSEVDKVLVSKELPKGESKFQFVDDFGKDRFIRIYVHVPIGQAYTISSIAIEGQALYLDILSIIMCLVGAAIIYFVGRKIEIVGRICKLVSLLWNKYNESLSWISSAYRKHTIKYDLERIYKEQFWLCLGSQLLILLFLICTNKLAYATNDDTTMVAIVGGGYVIPSQYVINMHIVIGYFLKELFTILPNINWVTVFYLCVYIISFACLDNVIVKKVIGSPIQFCGKTIVLDICFAILMGHFTFTVVAYTAAIVGTVLLIYTFERENKVISSQSVFGVALIVLSALVRAETLKTIMLMLILLCIYEIIRHRNFKYAVLEIIISGIMLLGINSNFMLMNCNPIEKEFLTWGELRSKALDCAAVPYEEEKFAEEKISEEEYKACYNVFYYIKDAVSEEKMEKLIKLNHVGNKYNFDLIGFFKEHFNYITSLGHYNIIYKWIFVCLFLFNIILGKKEVKSRILLIWLATVGVEFLYYFIQRALYRVVMPTYILGSILFLFFSDYDFGILKILCLNKINYKRIYIFSNIILVFAVTSVCIIDKREYEKAAYSTERQKVLDYMEENSDKLFFATEPSVFGIGVCRSVWDYPGKECNWNLVGDWVIYSVPSNQLMDAYGYSDYENIAKEAINNENILFLTTNVLGFEERTNYILNLYERYYDIRLKFEKVDDICTNPINNIERERWASYKLVNLGGE